MFRYGGFANVKLTVDILFNSPGIDPVLGKNYAENCFFNAQFLCSILLLTQVKETGVIPGVFPVQKSRKTSQRNNCSLAILFLLPNSARFIQIHSFFRVECFKECLFAV